MSSNCVNIHFTAEQREEAKAALAALAAGLPFLIDLTSEERSAMPRFGDKSRGFISKALDIAENNQEILPARSVLTNSAHERRCSLVKACSFADEEWSCRRQGHCFRGENDPLRIRAAAFRNPQASCRSEEPRFLQQQDLSWLRRRRSLVIFQGFSSRCTVQSGSSRCAATLRR